MQPTTHCHDNKAIKECKIMNSSQTQSIGTPLTRILVGVFNSFDTQNIVRGTVVL